MAVHLLLYKTLIHSIFLMLFWSCQPFNSDQDINKSNTGNTAPFSIPKNTWTLPSELDEISGLTWYKDNQVACINDEKGKIFIFDLKNGEIIRSIKFGKKGDYEGLAYKEPYFYIIRSNGKLFTYNEETEDTHSIQLPFNSKNDIEGICIENNTHLLIALKGNGGKNGKKANYKSIYRIDIENTEEPELAYKLPFKKKVAPSGIIINSMENKVYVLSHRSKEIYIFNKKNSHLENVLDLKKSLFPQPEGICISPKGSFYIANEKSEEDNATLLQF